MSVRHAGREVAASRRIERDAEVTVVNVKLKQKLKLPVVQTAWRFARHQRQYAGGGGLHRRFS